MIDRGFIKWQPFNSVISSKTILDNTNKEQASIPTLFPEEQLILSEQLKDAFYSKDKITILYYESGQIKNLNTFISKLNPNTNTLELGGFKTISFNQIYSLKTK
ncbi:MAG: YolD-like family protein [Ruminococcus sp.]|nr:YolD-like family protein [Ruminococcus sp.]